MYYFYATNLCDDASGVYVFDQEITKDDYVVVADWNDVPTVAKVTKTISKFQALTSNHEPAKIIQKVNLDEFNKQRENELNKRVLINKMQEKITEISLLEKLEKYATKDPKMLELFNEMKSLNEPKEEESESAF